MFMMATGFGRPFEWLITLLLILVTIFAVLKLDGVIHWSWFYVFIPFYIIVLQMIYLPILYDCLSVYFEKDFEDDLSPEKHVCCSPVFYYIIFVLTLGTNSNGLKRSLVYSVSGTVSAFLVMYGIKAGFFENDPSFPWWGVFFPLLIECCFGLFILIHGGGTLDKLWEDDKWIDRVLACLVIFMLFIFFIFTFLKLDDHISWTWFKVLSPLFIMKGFLVLIPLVLTIWVGCFRSSYLRRKTRWHQESPVFCMVSVVLIILVLVPLLTFEILLAQKAEGSNHLNYKLIFTPLFIIEGCSVVGCVALNIMALTAD